MGRSILRVSKRLLTEVLAWPASTVIEAVHADPENEDCLQFTISGNEVPDTVVCGAFTQKVRTTFYPMYPVPDKEDA